MKVNVYDIEQFPDGKKYRLYFTIKKGRAADPVLEVTKNMAEHPDILKLLVKRVERQLAAQEVLEKQTVKFVKGDVVLYGIQPDRGFNFHDIVIEKGNLLLTDKRDMIRAGELGIVLRDRETRIEILQTREEIKHDAIGMTVLGVVIAIYDTVNHRMIDCFSKEWASISDKMEAFRNEEQRNGTGTPDEGGCEGC